MGGGGGIILCSFHGYVGPFPDRSKESVSSVTTSPQLPLEYKLPAVSLFGPDFSYCSLLEECHFETISC